MIYKKKGSKRDTIRKGKMERCGMETEKWKAKVSASTLAVAAMHRRGVV